MMTTAQRIALRFALTIATIVLFLGVVINIAFMGSWWHREQSVFALPGHEGITGSWPQRVKKQFAQARVEFGPRNTLIVPIGDEEQRVLQAHTVFGNLAHFADERYLYGALADGKYFLVIDISPIMHNQIELLRITLIAILCSSLLGYIIAKWTVKRGLRDLYTIAAQLKNTDIASLNQSWNLAHLPVDDELNIVTQAVETMTTTVHKQVGQMQRFIANVSHEFKTPLMSLQSTLDLGEKTKNYESVLTQTRDQIDVMSRLLETLTTLVQTQKDALQKDVIDLKTTLTPLIESMQQKYPDITFVQHVQDNTQIMMHQGFFERIVTNLLDNAGKFTGTGGTVELYADAQGMKIIDTGSGIAAAQLEHIREPFWQGDGARNTEGFGLGLALVQQLVTLLDWHIVIKSVLGEGTTVTIKR